MKYLVDTNIFLHSINSNIYGVAKKCKDKGTPMCITQTIIDELTPGYYMAEEDATSMESLTRIQNYLKVGPFKVIELIDIKDVEGAKELLRSIRKRFYAWTHDADYLNMLISRGVITKEKVKSLKNKDLGECELLAIVKASHGEYILVTNDKGRVCLHPDQNIFEVYKDDGEVVIYIGDEWLEKIEYTNEDE